MNHRERIKAVLGGEQPDRIPVATWGQDFLREWSAEDLAAHTIERHRKYDYDFIKLNPRRAMFAEPLDNVYQPPTEQKFPRLLSTMVNSLDDIAKLKKASPSHPGLNRHISRRSTHV
jgi:uroporphyrinogen decarboxylase